MILLLQPLLVRGVLLQGRGCCLLLGLRIKEKKKHFCTTQVCALLPGDAHWASLLSTCVLCLVWPWCFLLQNNRTAPHSPQQWWCPWTSILIGASLSTPERPCHSTCLRHDGSPLGLGIHPMYGSSLVAVLLLPSLGHLRSPSDTALLQVCPAAALDGKGASFAIYTREPGSHWGHPWKARRQWPWCAPPPFR